MKTSRISWFKKKYWFRFIFLFFACACFIMTIVAALTTGREVERYYNLCSDKRNYNEVERQLRVIDGKIDFIDAGGIIPNHTRYELIEENEEIIRRSGFQNELKAGDMVTIMIAPQKYNCHSVVGVKKAGKVYLDFDEGFANFLKQPEYSKDYFYSGVTSVVVTGLIFFAMYIPFGFLSIKWRRTQATKKMNESKDNEMNIYWKYLIRYPLFISIIVLGYTFIILLMGSGDSIRYDFYANQNNYYDVYCEVIEKNGYKDLRIVYENDLYYTNGVFSLDEQNAQIAYHNGLSHEIQIGDFITVKYINGSYHGTPNHIVEIKKDNKVLGFEEGYENFMIKNKEAKTIFHKRVMVIFCLLVLSATLFIFFQIKFRKKLKSSILKETNSID